MRVGLFIPCYMDAFEPEVGIATLELLRRFDLDVTYPFDQTCCGQPMVNTGCHEEAAATEALFVRNFSGFDYVVAPSGSCTHQVREHMTAIPQTPDVVAVRARTYELVEFLHDVLKVDAFPWAEFPHRVSYHNNCNALRGIGHARPSELHAPFYSKPWTCSPRSRASRWSSSPAPTSAAASAAPSACSSRRCRPRWATTRSATTPAPGPRTSSRPIPPA